MRDSNKDWLETHKAEIKAYNAAYRAAHKVDLRKEKYRATSRRAGTGRPPAAAIVRV